MNKINFKGLPLFLFLFALLSTQGFSQTAVKLTWKVVRYDITATLPPDLNTGRALDVTAKISVRNVSSSPARTLSLRISEQAKVDSASVNGATADFSVAPETIKGARPLQKVVVRVPLVGAGAEVEASIKYKLNVKENDGLASIASSGSQFLPFSFWYPTPTSWFFTGGADFAPIKLTVNGPNDSRVFSSGSSSGNSYDLKIAGQPFFVAGPMTSKDVGGVEMAYLKRGTVSIREGRLERIAELLTKANKFVGTRLGTELGVPLRAVFVRRGSGFSDSGTVLLDEAVLIREKLDSSAVQSMVEGIAKSYLGNLISVRGDGYGVIREGLARFIADQFIEQEFGENVADVERLRQRTSYSAISDRDAPLNIVSPVDAYYYTESANKGAMIWAHLDSVAGDSFYQTIRDQARDGSLSLSDLRAAFSSQKEFLDYAIDRVTEMNLMVGLPQKTGGQTKSALRNLGDIDATVEVVATTKSGKKIGQTVTIKAKSFGEAVFDTPEEIVRVEVDARKIYPQTIFYDDVAPRILDEQDPVLFVKKDFDRQKFSEAAKKASSVLDQYPAFTDVRALLARSQLEMGDMAGARSNFEKVLESRLPSPQSLAWSEFGLGQAARKEGKGTDALGRFERALDSDADYGATLGALKGIIELGTGAPPSDDVKAFFTSFDQAVVSNTKAQVDALVAGGELSRFSASVTGQAQEWATDIRFAKQVNEVDILVGANVQLKLLNRDVESGVALFRISKTADGYRLSSVDIFEVG